ncbi:deleted in malignant brain tumors 1 protein-like [Lytechinus variegatus]|uniref:deleted in malignant brain tumors 1 protein-like n=1 Tax=Lytechinus variegatus TaxID=7654 RepID=UPI001BB1AA62|nr:deleted in malignant brain tumors 1 protein-like [Lytechinus variegatus]
MVAPVRDEGYTSYLTFLLATVQWYSCYSQNYYDIRLVGGSHENEGRVEIYYSSQWNTICDSGWGIEEARVICRQLGFNTVNAVARHNAYYGRGIGLTRKLNCSGDETRVQDCTLTHYDCYHSEDAGVECDDTPTTYDPFGRLTTMTTIDYYDRNTVRLVGGNTPREGRVEIWFNGQWNTVCDDSFYNDEAEVICRQLGYNTNNAVARGYAYYGEGSGPTILRVTCYGWELTLSSCTVTSRYSSLCGHHEDAGVECGDTSTTNDPFGWLTTMTTIDYYDRNTVRLVGGNTPREGRVEIWFNGQWNTVCDDSFRDDEAEVICRQLGYNTNNAVARGYAYYGEGSGPTILRVTCYGWELTLSSCTVTSRYSSFCSHQEDAGIECGYSTSPTFLPPPSWFTSYPSSRIIGIMSFIGVSLFLLTIASFVAVLYTCNKGRKISNSATVVELQPMSSTSTTPSSALDPTAMTQMQVNLPTPSE